MTYFAPYIDSTGMHIPTYNDIVEYFCLAARRIFGQGLYLGSDSMDYQMIAEFAEKLNDTNEAALAAYNARSPSTAIGAGLDAVVGINGIQRKVASRSVCDVQITGTAGTTIINGAVTDINGNVWDLPASVSIPETGTITVSATCREYGIIGASPNTLTIIKTPTLGWISVTNSGEATVGNVVETDSQLRARRAQSVAIPSRAILDGLRGAIAAIDDVTRQVVLENDQKNTDKNGLPANSICAVVEGGSDEEIARTIYHFKTPGCYTHGSTLVEVSNENGGTDEIRFMRPSYREIYVNITIKRGSGYFNEIPNLIRSSIADFLDELTIGDDLYVSLLWWAAQKNVESLTAPGFSIRSIVAGTSADQMSTDDISFAFYEAPHANMNNITVIVES